MISSMLSSGLKPSASARADQVSLGQPLTIVGARNAGGDHVHAWGYLAGEPVGGVRVYGDGRVVVFGVDGTCPGMGRGGMVPEVKSDNSKAADDAA